MSGKENTVLRQDFITSVAGYPYTTAARLAESYFLQHILGGDSLFDNKAVTEIIDPDSIKIKQEGLVLFPGTGEDGPHVPIYKIKFTTDNGKRQYAFNERYAVMSYGSNASPDVLARKFGPQNYSGSPYCPVVMVDIADHSIVESACISAAGNVPVTLLQTPGSSARVGLSFYRECQLLQMTQTEPNYDLVLLNNKNVLSLNGQRIECQAMVYESIWGGLLRNGELLHNDAIANQAVDHVQRISTLDAMRLAYAYAMEESPLRSQWLKIMNAQIQQHPFEEWIDHLRTLQEPNMDTFNLERSLRRLAVNTVLAQYSQSRNLDATVLKPASFGSERLRITRAIALHA